MLCINISLIRISKFTELRKLEKKEWGEGRGQNDGNG